MSMFIKLAFCLAHSSIQKGTSSNLAFEQNTKKIRLSKIYPTPEANRQQVNKEYHIINNNKDAYYINSKCMQTQTRNFNP